jgi:hypothetical protein
MAHIIFVHGLSNKPPPLDLHRLWKRALAKDEGIDLVAMGIESSMMYWADVFYAQPDINAAALEEADEPLASAAQLDCISQSELLISSDMPLIEVDYVKRLAARMDVDVVQNIARLPSGDMVIEKTLVQEKILVPGFLKERVMAAFVQEAYAFIFDKSSNPRPGATYRVREELRRRFIDAVKAAREMSPKGPIIVLSHSMGTMIAYDCLKRIPDCPPVDTLMTIGSPLGIDEVQEGFLPEWTRKDGFPSDKLKGKWINVFDPFDAVARLDPRLANDYCNAGVEVVDDIEEQNWGAWRHNITHYLQGNKLRQALTVALKTST